MQREHPRMSSCRGSSRGQASTQRSAISPSSSVEVTSDHHRSSGRATGRGRALGYGEIMECGHTAHPTIRGQVEAPQRNPPPVQGIVPTIDMQVPTIDLKRPIKESSSPDSEATLAGPSELAQRILLSDSDDPKHFRGKVEDQPHTTDDE